jgi:hypothetical protein
MEDAEEAEQEDPTSWVQSVHDDCMAAIAAGAGSISPLTSTSLNGKSFTKSLKMDPGQLLSVCREALDIYRGRAIASSTIDMSPYSR